VTNLHVWLLTVRLRDLPEPLGKYYIQGLLDHFFIDVEERVRAVLQPSTRPRITHDTDADADGAAATSTTEFYTIPTATKQAKGNAPERIVTRQMKILREQWAGMGMAFDLGLVRGDAELASAVWRNFLGARGARGIVYPSSTHKPAFRRSVNLVGGEIEKVSELDKKGLEAEEARDDGSGVHDFAPDEAGLYVQYPELMADVVRYMRKELVRLQGLSDAQIQGTNGEPARSLQFGRVRE
jgi:cytochrome b pre-mRNA-processing protein 3